MPGCQFEGDALWDAQPVKADDEPCSSIPSWSDVVRSNFTRHSLVL